MNMLARALLALVGLSGVGLAQPAAQPQPQSDLHRLGAELEVEVAALVRERTRLRFAAEEAAATRRSALASVVKLRRRIAELTDLEERLWGSVEEVDEALTEIDAILE